MRAFGRPFFAAAGGGRSLPHDMGSIWSGPSAGPVSTFASTTFEVQLPTSPLVST